MHAEREKNEKLLAYIEDTDESLQSSCAETAYLRNIVTDLQKKTQALEYALVEAQRGSITSVPHNGIEMPQYSMLLEIVSEQSAAMNARSSDLTEQRGEILQSTK